MTCHEGSRRQKKYLVNIWNKVFKSGLIKFFKGGLPQNLLSPLLNALFHLLMVKISIHQTKLSTKKFFCIRVRNKARSFSREQTLRQELEDSVSISSFNVDQIILYSKIGSNEFKADRLEHYI